MQMGPFVSDEKQRQTGLQLLFVCTSQKYQALGAKEHRSKHNANLC